MLGGEGEMGLGRVVGLGPEAVTGLSPFDRLVRGLHGVDGVRAGIRGADLDGGRGLDGMRPGMGIVVTGVRVVVDDDGDRRSRRGWIEER